MLSASDAIPRCSMLVCVGPAYANAFTEARHNAESFKMIMHQVKANSSLANINPHQDSSYS